MPILIFSPVQIITTHPLLYNFIWAPLLTIANFPSKKVGIHYIIDQGLLEFIWMEGCFDYFSTAIQVKCCFANSITNANCRPFIVHGMSYRPTDLSLLKGF